MMGMGLVKGGKRRVVMVMVVMLVTISMMQSVSGVLHKLGGNRYQGWRSNYNYTQWSMNEHFIVGDWLYFGYERSLFNVLQVNQSGYENCITENPIKNVTGGAGRDVFQLLRPITYYFTTSEGTYCQNGMKVAIPVVNAPPTPTPSKSTANDDHSV
ncbi:Lamin-like protein [Thalictrum thalictroides]|uniref:Lamin-like protein n=1 Tax=Thalictrum thalictroides TaxID=46969 RepID=A0A7J6VIM7_THATH|nr:Lamin-like protein [Thalictrum thalictroides]